MPNWLLTFPNGLIAVAREGNRGIPAPFAIKPPQKLFSDLALLGSEC